MPKKPDLGRRASGILLHPTSLPGPRGGDLGAGALAFADFLADCGQSWWQMLPVCPPDETGSPYASPSAFAGSPELISADILAAEGLLKKAELGQPRAKALRAAYVRLSKRLEASLRRDFEAFREREAWWLADHALFMALKDANSGRPWTEWDAELRRRDAAGLARARERLADELRWHEFAQWLFSRQFEALRRHAAVRGVALMGDAPIYVSHDSADCWAHQELFKLDDGGRPKAVAGVPPDYFSATGQYWGNPIYDWERHAATGFSWWLARLKACAERFDAVRLDHFIGFRNYWEIPAAEKTAVSGRWVEAPGDALFDAVRAKLPQLGLVAEDLGATNPSVYALRDKYALPGMRLAQFSFSGGDQDWPSQWPENSVGYTGTHDNDTSRGWFEDPGGRNALRSASQAEKERANFLRASGGAPEGPAWAMMRLVWQSPSRLAIAPLQDVLDLPTESRMNRPGTAEGNWRWRFSENALTPNVAGRLGALTGSARRTPS